MKLQSTNPSRNYEVIGSVEISTLQDIKKAVNRAREALPNWKSITLEKRIKAVKSIIPIVEKNEKKIALLVSKEVGRPITSSLTNVRSGLNYLREYINTAEKYLSPITTHETDKEIHQVIFNLGV